MTTNEGRPAYCNPVLQLKILPTSFYQLAVEQNRCKRLCHHEAAGVTFAKQKRVVQAIPLTLQTETKMQKLPADLASGPYSLRSLARTLLTLAGVQHLAVGHECLHTTTQQL